MAFENSNLYDYSKLKGCIVEKSGSQAKFAEAIGLSEHSVSAKLKGKAGWRQSEILKACALLDIPIAQIPTYFFTLKVQY